MLLTQADPQQPAASARPLRPAGLPDRVADGITRLIIEGRLVPGDKLPAEADLAVRFGVSKPVVREALRLLAGIGVIESRKGRVATVNGLNTKPLEHYFRLTVGLTHDGLREAFQLRRVLEEYVVGVAAEQIKPADVPALRRCIGQLYAVRDLDQEWAEADLAFHSRLFAIANNATMGRVIEALTGALSTTARGLRAVYHPADTLASFRRHEAIFDAVVARDPVAARAAMGAHFDSTDVALEALGNRFASGGETVD